jgi:hypothetical protein
MIQLEERACMEQETVSELFSKMDNCQNAEEYNFEHFTRTILINEIKHSTRPSVLKCGYPAPVFDLEDTERKRQLLSNYKGKPVLLHFGSITCPLTAGSLDSLNNLYTIWGDKIQFLTILIRQAHPGGQYPVYRTYEQKMIDAERFRESGGIVWPVLCDHLEGKTHQVYSAMSNPSILIDKFGRIAFINAFTHAPTLYKAFEKLLDQDGTGVVNGGVEKMPHFLAAIVNGWPAIEHGGPDSATELDAALPMGSSILHSIYKFKPAFDPLALRVQPLHPVIKAGVVSFGILLFFRHICGQHHDQ